jgi:hypothetical protein
MIESAAPDLGQNDIPRFRQRRQFRKLSSWECESASLTTDPDVAQEG